MDESRVMRLSTDRRNAHSLILCAAESFRVNFGVVRARCLLELVLSLKRWLAKPVIVDSGVDRPFKLRRISFLLLAGGWVVFFAACLIATWARMQQIPVATFTDLINGANDGLAWSLNFSYLAGGAMFYAGLLSVPVFDRRDGIPLRSSK